MPRSDHSSTTMLSTSDMALLNGAGLPSSTGCYRQPERLTLELDFAKAIHHDETSTTHPHMLFSPVHYEAGYAYPLLVWLHGCGGDERQIMRIMPSISMRNYVAVAPRGIEKTHDSEKSDRKSTDVAGPNLNVTSILRERSRSKIDYDWPGDVVLETTEQRIFDCISLAKQRCHIAPNRVFLAGFGSGGSMALRMALLYPEHFAGVASLGGPFPLRNRLLPRWVAARSLRVFLGVGQTSPVFPPHDACQSLELLHTAGVSVAVHEYPCGQELVSAMLQDLNRWMMGIVCGE